MNQRMNNIGFHKTDGFTREITIREQLIRNINFVGINDIKHPIHRIIDVKRDKLDDLLKFTEEELTAMSPEQFI